MAEHSFREIQVGDRPVLEKYLFLASRSCADYAFANLFAWSGFYGSQWMERDGFLVIRFRIAGSEKWAYLEPLGSGDRLRILEFIRKDARSKDEPLRLFSLSREFAESLRKTPGFESLHIYPNRSFGNYIYPRRQLAELAGKKFHAKRNHIEKFQRLYPEFHSRKISSQEDIPALHKIIDKWIRSRKRTTRTVLEEKAAIEKFLESYRELGLFGVILFVRDVPVAFSFGSQVTRDTFCVHIEKADTSYEGAYPAINRLLAESLPESIRNINREDDMGIPGLRQSKLSYHPETITEEFFACDFDSIEANVWKLWQRNFPGDDDAFMQAFLYPYSNDKTRITLYENGVLASMLHLFEMESLWGIVGYLYGLATDERFQGKGLASRLIVEALQRAKKAGAILVWTIPENRKFGGWKRFGFSDIQDWPLAFETDDGFSLGENPETDFGVFRIVDMRAHLERFARKHPEIQARFSVKDPLFPENSGTYALESGKLFYRQDISDSTVCTPRDIAALYPPEKSGTLVPVVPGQR